MLSISRDMFNEGDYCDLNTEVSTLHINGWDKALELLLT